jgi:hypothetical protein
MGLDASSVAQGDLPGKHAQHRAVGALEAQRAVVVDADDAVLLIGAVSN